MSQRIHLARLPRFQLPGIPGSKVILLRKKQRFFNFFFFVFGQQKVYIRAHNWISKWMHVESPQNGGEKWVVLRSSITTWSWLVVIFMWIATQFWSFLKIYLKKFQHSTQLSSLIIPVKHHSNATECSLLPFYFYVHIGLFQLAPRAIWNNLSKEQFSNNAQRRQC